MPAWPRQNRGSSGCFEAVAACATIRPTSGYSGYEMPSVAAVRWRQFFVPVLRGLYRKGVVLGAFREDALVGVCGIARPGRCQPPLGEKLRVVPAVPVGVLTRVPGAKIAS